MYRAVKEMIYIVVRESCFVSRGATIKQVESLVHPILPNGSHGNFFGILNGSLLTQEMRPHLRPHVQCIVEHPLKGILASPATRRCSWTNSSTSKLICSVA